MRLLSTETTQFEKESLYRFADWVLEVTDGIVPTISFPGEYYSYWIKIPFYYLTQTNNQPLLKLFTETDSNFPEIYAHMTYL